MDRRAFNLVELVVVVIIIGVLVTIAIPSYRATAEKSKALACQSNMTILKASLDAYALDNDVMPGDLSGIDDKYIKEAYAKVMNGPGAWKRKLAYFIVSLEEGSLAHAGVLQDISLHNPSVLNCPANRSGGRSYGINSAISNMTSSGYKNLSSATILIGDCDNSNGAFTGAPATTRHTTVGFYYDSQFAQGVKVDGTIYKSSDGGTYKPNYPKR
jgi:prepilin-type N-terminal cleavage/methylation domain-containing protein